MENNLNNQVEENVNEEVMENVEIEENVELEEDVEITEEEFQADYDEDQEDYIDELYSKKKKDPLVIVIAVMSALIIILLGLLIWKSVPSKEAQNNDQTVVNRNFSTLYDYYLVTKKDNEAKAKAYEENEKANTEKYNNLGYKNVSGDTLGDVYASYEMQGMSFEQFLASFGLPTDMTKGTYLEVATYLMPVSSYMETFETEFGMTKITLDSGEEVEIDKDMPIGLVIDDMKVSDAIKFMMGQDDLESFKTEYGFGDEVTEETKWKEIRSKVEDADIEKREAAEKEAESIPEEGTEEATEEEVTEEVEE